MTADERNEGAGAWRTVAWGVATCLLNLAVLACGPRETGGAAARGAPISPVEDEAAKEVLRASTAYFVVTLAADLDHPWAIGFLPNGNVLLTERSGRMRMLADGQLSPPLEGVPTISPEGESGLLDVVVDDRDAGVARIYYTYTKTDEGSVRSTVAVGTAIVGERGLEEARELFVADAWRDSSLHFGSRLALSQDGLLFVTVGDRMVLPEAGKLTEHPSQRLDTHIGKTLRLRRDGTAPSDNPFVTEPGARPEIWSRGHLNSQGLAFDGNGRLWETEHGPQGGDELNVIEPGGNYGWPVVGRGVRYSNRRQPRPIHHATVDVGIRAPVFFWNPSIAPSGLAIYNGSQFPEWRGSAFVGGLAGEYLSRLTLSDERVISEERLLVGLGRVRDVRQGPDGLLYVVLDRREANSGTVVRIEPTTEERSMRWRAEQRRQGAKASGRVP